MRPEGPWGDVKGWQLLEEGMRETASLVNCIKGKKYAQEVIQRAEKAASKVEESYRRLMDARTPVVEVLGAVNTGLDQLRQELRDNRQRLASVELVLEALQAPVQAEPLDVG